MMLMSPGSTLEETRLIPWPATSLQRGIMGANQSSGVAAPAYRELRDCSLCLGGRLLRSGLRCNNCSQKAVCQGVSVLTHAPTHVTVFIMSPGLGRFLVAPRSPARPWTTSHLWAVIHTGLKFVWHWFESTSSASNLFFPLRESEAVWVWRADDVTCQSKPSLQILGENISLKIRLLLRKELRHRCKNTHMWS